MDSHAFDTIAKLFADRRLSRRQALARGGAGLAAGALAATGLATAAAQTMPSGSVAPHRPSDAASTTLTPRATGEFTLLETQSPEVTAIATPTTEPEKETMFLFLQSFETGSLVPVAGQPGHYTLTLRQGLGETIYFSDRPHKIVGTIPTPQFLDALGFTPDNPPNAALVGHRDATHKDIVVLELLNPTYDTSSNTATYEVTLLKDWHKLDEQFQQTPDDEQHLPRDFTAAHLFIDDCPDQDFTCVKPGSNDRSHSIRNGTCWSFPFSCDPCRDYSPECNATFPGFCQGQCHIGKCYANLQTGVVVCN